MNKFCLFKNSDNISFPQSKQCVNNVNLVYLQQFVKKDAFLHNYMYKVHIKSLINWYDNLIFYLTIWAKRVT